jgi:hypothetical protein
VGEVAEVLQRHALEWGLWRHREDPAEWVEFGPRFRERAELEHAAAALQEGRSLETLAAFEVDLSDGTGAVFQMVSKRDYDVMFEVAGAKPVDPAQMSAAMKLACALARALASRLNAVVPAPFRVGAEEERVYLYDDHTMITYWSLVDEEIDVAVMRVLDNAQDDITEHLTTPWPHDPSRGYAFHEPEVVIREGAVHFWYGAEASPVLSFEPIPLSELQA